MAAAGADTVKVYLLATAIAAIHYFLRWYCTGYLVTSDGHRYIAMGNGENVIKPYHLRWLLPLILKDNVRAWGVMSAACTILTAPALVAYMHTFGFSDAQCLFGVAMFVGLHGVFAINVMFPLLTDQCGIFLSVVISTILRSEPSGIGLVAAIALSLASGGVKEVTPVFAAIAALNPIPLVGLVVPAIRHLTHTPQVLDLEKFWDSRVQREIMERPISAARDARRYDKKMPSWTLFSWPHMCAPWGIVLPLAIWNGNWLLALPLVAGYGMNFVATDLVRLYQWGFPLVIVFAVSAGLPRDLWPFAILAHWFNPWQHHHRV